MPASSLAAAVPTVPADVTGAEPPTQPASPEAPAPKAEVAAEVRESEVVISLADRRWRVRGLDRNLSYEQLRVNLLVSRQGADAFHVDTFDLYSARQRALFVRQAAAELMVKEDVVKADLGRVLLKLEELQEERISASLEPKTAAVELSPAEREEALGLLRDPHLVDRVGEAFEACGLVGEETSRLVAYLAALSRKLERPLGVLVQSSSAAGKSALMSAVLALVPEEDRVSYSAMTGQSLFYMGERDLKHKVLAIAEEEGAERASYALKLLQSEGELSIASTGKDPATGRLVTHEYRVEGPAAILLTTTAVDLDPELQNRCLVLSVDESREQTRAIHRRQREADTLEGLRARRRRDHVLRLHRNAQRLLQPLAVLNPFALELTYPDSCTRTRRDHEKYLALIRAIALLHQHQRPVRHDGDSGQGEPYVEVTLADVELANRLSAEVLGRSLDELPPQTRRFLELLSGWVATECGRQRVEQSHFRFTRRQVWEALSSSYDQVRTHLGRLVELEYVLVHRGSRGQSFVYELLWDGQGSEGERFVMGLLDAEALRRRNGRTVQTLGGAEAGSGGAEVDLGAPLGPHRGAIGYGLEDPGTAEKPCSDGIFQPELPLGPGDARHRVRSTPAPYASRGGSKPQVLAAAADERRP